MDIQQLVDRFDDGVAALQRIADVLERAIELDERDETREELLDSQVRIDGKLYEVEVDPGSVQLGDVSPTSALYRIVPLDE